MGQRRLIREYELTKLMLDNRPGLHVEFLRVMGSEQEPFRLSDRDIIQAILDREFPVEEPAPHQ